MLPFMGAATMITIFTQRAYSIDMLSQIPSRRTPKPKPIMLALAVRTDSEAKANHTSITSSNRL